jgi:predicted RNA-binding Zn-ribbon protein involved in translation (DUF1610 family)
MSGEQYKREQEEIKVPKLKSPYNIDLNSIGGSGEFPCPSCGTKISPDDKTEDTYKIIETGVKGDELNYITLQCNKCGGMIKVGGFLSHSLDKPEQEQVI